MNLGKYPSQILCLAESVRFTSTAEQLLSEGAGQLQNMQADYHQRLQTLTSDQPLRPSTQR